MTDPNGYQVESVFGIQTVDPLPVNKFIGPDFGPDHPREGKIQRAQKLPCPVKRLGHVVLNVPNCDVMDTFYKTNYGFISSDECYNPDNSEELAVAFHRCDKAKSMSTTTRYCLQSRRCKN